MKLGKNQKLYQALMLYFAEELYKRPDNEEKLNNFNTENKKSRDSLIEGILDKISKILLSYTIADSFMNINLKNRNKLYADFEKIINESIIEEIKQERIVTKDILTNTIKDKYNIENYIWSLGNTKEFKISTIGGKQLDKILNNKFKGEDEDIAKNWSERIWDNKNQLAKDMKVNINKFLKGETSVNDIEKLIRNKYGAKTFETERLVLTEITRVQSETNDLWASEHGITKQLFMATLDNKTSKICRSLDGNVYDINDPDKPIPPLHPYCRSTLVNLPSESSWKPKTRLNNITQQRINWTTFEEWSKNQES